MGRRYAKGDEIPYFIKCNDLLQQLKRTKRENRLDTRLRNINRYKLLIIDEIGLEEWDPLQIVLKTEGRMAEDSRRLILLQDQAE